MFTKICNTVVMLEIKAHSLRGSIVPALLLLVGSCALQSRAAAFPDWTDCPAVCRCKWTSGKKSALCPDAGLENLPATLDPDMQVLDLSGNRIPSLQSEIFKRVGLVNLQRVFLRNAGIHKIHGDSFRGMGILIEVDLSDNHLKSLEPDTFHGNERLRILVLSGNPLVTLRSHQFPVLQHLRTLELQRCSLKEIHPQAFAHLGGLESLKLDGNQLEYLDSRVITCLIRLSTLTLESNNWICDCRLRDFRSWLVDNNGVPKKIYGTSQICQGPSRLRGRHWESVKPTEFACEPKVFVLANTMQEEVSGNLSLACSTTGDPEPEVSWQLNGASLNASRVEQTFSTSIINQFEDDESVPNKINEKWYNLTIYNASESDAGEYACFAKNVAGTSSDVVNIVVPRVFSAPTLSQTDNWYLWLSLAGGGAAALCASLSAVILVLCMCGTTRRKRTREKVKLQSSGSFGDQEKKLLDLSVTTTTGGSANGNDRSSARGSFAETCSPGDLELTERGSICDPIAAATVTVERLRPECNVPSALRAIPCTNVFPPPPPEFTTGVLPAGIFGNIFISVSLPQDGERCYPDLLDIPVHSGTIADKFNVDPHPPSSSMVSSYATLPRRSLRSADLSSPYDNMGPRVTATGSSTFSLTDDLRLSPPPPPRIIKPPIEFVSL
ncbi:leucine-rich repeat-containing protein 24-like [Venturia canescens]|uniref:leucine-rich repeat-containing protein 24-like n=1 Tax=Venturia canescens TaxID=32260 RepID=UPI001C9C52A1|nr:leucine-rich repeat-containing protein 24-like [Venturia canescens]